MKDRKIFIDPGHGGSDPGALGQGGTKESDIALQVSKLLKKELEKRRRSSTLSRIDDKNLSINSRINQAKSSNADILVSIHCNSASTVTNGVETWYHTTSIKGKKLAERIQNSIIANTSSRDRGIKPDSSNARFKNGIPILAKTPMPAVLVEMEFINNPEIEKLMNTEAWKQTMAESIADGILEYFRDL